MQEPKYYNKRWHYPADWTPDDKLEFALRFALEDYEHLSRLTAHPLTQGMAVLRDALSQFGEAI